MPPARPVPDDDSVIDITGLFERLAVANAAPPPPPKPKPSLYVESYPGSGVMIYNYNYYYQEPPTLGATYGEKLSLTPRQVTWLDKFYLPNNNTFLAIEPALQATLLLYLAVLPALDQQLKRTGTTLAKEAKALEDEAKHIAYQEGYWYQNHSRGGKAGTDIYLAIFRLCENALRLHYDYTRKGSKLFPRQIARLEACFQQQLGQRIAALLPTLLPHVPPPGPEAELIFNEQAPQRWKPYFERLTKLLPAKVPAFIKAVEQLLKANVRNPTRENICFEAAKLLAHPDREAALRMYLRYLHDGANWVHIKPKTLPKGLDKVLFLQTEHAQRFTMIVNLLKLNDDRKTALEKVSTVYAVERKKIELDMGAVQAARQQHAGTVELLNAYLQDEPAPATPSATTPATPKKKGKAPGPQASAIVAVPPKNAAAKALKATKASVETAAAAGPAFAPGLSLNAVQQDLLQLFAARKLALSQAEVEGFAKGRAALRNQLINGLNEACYELLDDVLIEETADGYAIYAPYYQKITA